MDLRQASTIPDRSHVKIVLRGPTEHVHVPQLSSGNTAAQCEHAGPVSYLAN